MSSMQPLIRLGAFAALLVALFVAAFWAGGTFVPQETVRAWNQQSSTQHSTGGAQNSEGIAGDDTHGGQR